MRALSRLNTPETSRHLTNALRWFDPIFGRYEVAQAELEQQAKDDDLKHDIGRKLKMIERCTGAFIEPARALTTAESAEALIRCSIQLLRVIGPAIRAVIKAYQDTNSAGLPRTES